MALLDREKILVALGALDNELGRVGVRGEVFVVGGAAMALAYDARRSTVDIDPIFAPPTEMRSAARNVVLLQELFHARRPERNRDREGPELGL